jgi:hypothetical protein
MIVWIHYIPLLNTLVSIPFTVTLFRHWRKKPQVQYLLWWTLGVLFYGLGTFTESLTTLFGWHVVVFKAWYISGALLGGAPLAQGTVFLLFSDTTGRRTSVILKESSIVLRMQFQAGRPRSGRVTTPGIYLFYSHWLRYEQTRINKAVTLRI